MIAARPPFADALIAELRDRLLQARHALLRTVTATDEEIASLETPVPGDAMDRASASSIAQLVSRLGGQEKRELDEIAEALRRLGSGAYGRCETCTKPIGVARLRAVPATRFCVHCQEAQEVAP